MMGLFIGVSPLWGYQIATVLLLAYLFRLNKAIAVVASNISIPPMIPLIIFASLKLGEGVLGQQATTMSFSTGISLEAIKLNVFQYVVGSLCLGVLLATVAGVVTYGLLTIFRRQ